MWDNLDLPVVFAVRREGDAEAVREVLEEEGARIREGDPTEMEPGDAKIIQVTESLPDDRWLKKQVKKSWEFAEQSSQPGEATRTGKRERKNPMPRKRSG